MSCYAINFTEFHLIQYMFAALCAVERAVLDPQDGGGDGDYISMGVRRKR